MIIVNNRLNYGINSPENNHNLVFGFITQICDVSIFYHINIWYDVSNNADN